ncbi:MAG: PilZ domain-containing protein [Nitrospirae bacterium]|nr:PilZ domain-containing protein [Nitrospirota bacterium]
MEHRKHPRYQFQCEIWFPGKEESVAGTVSNLSVGGCKVESKASVYIGMYLALQICLPGQEATLKVDQAAVRWARKEEFGLEFISMRPEEEERLRDVVGSLRAGQSH